MGFLLWKFRWLRGKLEDRQDLLFLWNKEQFEILATGNRTLILECCWWSRVFDWNFCCSWRKSWMQAQEFSAEFELVLVIQKCWPFIGENPLSNGSCRFPISGEINTDGDQSKGGTVRVVSTRSTVEHSIQEFNWCLVGGLFLEYSSERVAVNRSRVLN